VSWSDEGYLEPPEVSSNVWVCSPLPSGNRRTQWHTRTLTDDIKNFKVVLTNGTYQWKGVKVELSKAEEGK
jgi:hypothetical protein